MLILTNVMKILFRFVTGFCHLHLKYGYDKRTVSDRIDKGKVRGQDTKLSKATFVPENSYIHKTPSPYGRKDLGHKNNPVKDGGGAGRGVCRASLIVTFNDPSSVKCQRGDRVYIYRAYQKKYELDGMWLCSLRYSSAPSAS